MDFNNYLLKENEKPLDIIKSDGGFTSIFRTIACIGDSLSSGEFQFRNDEGNWIYYDRYEYSWGQFIARMTGSKVYNFSRGGMTAKEYIESFAQANDYFNDDKKSQCYIIALGVNDVAKIMKNELEMGNEADITVDFKNFNKNFIGYFSAIIAKYKEISPFAKFFIVTPPQDGKDDERQNFYDKLTQLLYKTADKFENTYIVDLRKYSPIYDEAVRDIFYLAGHLTPAGYKITAEMIASYIDYIIRSDHKAFKDVGLICSEYENLIKNTKE